MSQFDHEPDKLPPGLDGVADLLRSHRHEASALELDQTKTRIMKRAGGPSAARGGGMRKRGLLTALITVAAIGMGSSAALAVGGFHLASLSPFHHRVVTHRAPRLSFTLPGIGGAAGSASNAALAQYPPPPTCHGFIQCLLQQIFTPIVHRLEHRLPFIAQLLASLFGIPYP